MVNRDTEDFDDLYCDSEENRARVVQLLKQKGLPTDGWYCEWWEDMGDADNKCELCGIERVRYVHHMFHPITHDRLSVGCYCAGGMENDLPAAIERERENVNRLKRKARFDGKQWSEATNLIQPGRRIWILKYKGYKLRIMRSQSGWYGYQIGACGWCWNYYKTFNMARDALFDEFDQLSS